MKLAGFPYNFVSKQIIIFYLIVYITVQNLASKFPWSYIPIDGGADGDILKMYNYMSPVGPTFFLQYRKKKKLYTKINFHGKKFSGILFLQNATGAAGDIHGRRKNGKICVETSFFIP